jgi:hypothetical protein
VAEAMSAAMTVAMTAAMAAVAEEEALSAATEEVRVGPCAIFPALALSCSALFTALHSSSSPPPSFSPPPPLLLFSPLAPS